ncbi:ran-binding protein 9 isoform X1 [Procambarus clarkii]|uniref:ran-binding protein 9 isoform X1 n=1 Tax=Procambarus clarkii TaxID=6728 RepID=UPI001E677D61|nr:ran-binding protein 9-like isoform X1 [Procambarus clarkii]
MATSSGRCSVEPPLYGPHSGQDPIKALYPMVNEDETPLPRCWSSKDKYSFIGLSQNNLRVHYKGHGKNHKDAASVRATNPIPAACGLYYYEVKIVSKGRDGYMGIGLSSQGVNMNRLPGWDKNSFGYHGDDGHSFCSSGSGHPYGPTFTTGDVIGCGINLIDNVCFYTKNGHYLGVAFTDLPAQLYPTVGLQTPGEVVDANFGQAPFVFDIGEMMRELQCRVRTTIQNFPVPDTYGQWQTMLHRMVSTYLVHHGYCATAEAFARSTSQDFDEELTSIKNRQKIQKLVLGGRMGEAIETVQQLYPGLLENNHNLLFMLKVRQFIEMVNGTDTEVRGVSRSPSRPPTHESSPSPPCWSNGRTTDPVPGTSSTPPSSSTTSTPVIQQHTSVIQSTKNVVGSGPTSTSPVTTEELNQRNAQDLRATSPPSATNGTTPVIHPPAPSGSSSSSASSSSSNSSSNMHDSDTEMECMEANSHHLQDFNNSLGDTSHSNGFSNGFSKDIDIQDENEEAMEVENSVGSRKMCGGNPAAIERMLAFGREVQHMSQVLRRELGKNDHNKKILQDAFSLLAYNDPWNSPVGWQLDPLQREPVCQSLNSAILESHQLPRRPPLEICVAHTKQLINLMSRSGLGSCAFASVDSILGSQQ